MWNARSILNLKENCKWFKNGFQLFYSNKGSNQKDKLLKNLKDKFVKPGGIQDAKGDTLKTVAATTKLKKTPETVSSQRNAFASLKNESENEKSTTTVGKEKGLNVKDKSDTLKEAAKSENEESTTDMLAGFFSFLYGETPPKSVRPCTNDPKTAQATVSILKLKTNKKDDTKKTSKINTKKDKKTKSESILSSKKPSTTNTTKTNPVVSKSKTAIPKRSSLNELRKRPQPQMKSKKPKSRSLETMIPKTSREILVDAKKTPTSAYSSPVQTLVSHKRNPSNPYLQQHASKHNSTSENKDKKEYNFSKDLGLNTPKVSQNKETNNIQPKKDETKSKADSGLSSFLSDKLEETGTEKKKAEEGSILLEDWDLIQGTKEKTKTETKFELSKKDEVKQEASAKTSKKSKKVKKIKKKLQKQEEQKTPENPPFISDPSMMYNRQNVQSQYYNYNYNYNQYQTQYQQQNQQQNTYDKNYRYSYYESFPTKSYYQSGRSESHNSTPWYQNQHSYTNQPYYNYNYNQNYNQQAQNYNQQAQNYNQQAQNYNQQAQNYPGASKHYVYPQNSYTGSYPKPYNYNYTYNASETEPKKQQTWSKDAVGETKFKTGKATTKTNADTPNVHSKKMSTKSKSNGKKVISQSENKTNKLSSHAQNLVQSNEWPEIED